MDAQQTTKSSRCGYKHDREFVIHPSREEAKGKWKRSASRARTFRHHPLFTFTLKGQIVNN